MSYNKPFSDKKNTERTTKAAVSLFNRTIEKCERAVDNKPIKCFEDLIPLANFDINKLLILFCKKVRMKDGRQYANSSLKLHLLSFQRALK